MKKILTIVISLCALTTVFAQNGRSKDSRGQSRDIVFGKSNLPPVHNNKDYRNDNYSFTAREKNDQIERINRDFDYKIMAIKRDRYLRRGEMNRQIRMLERERTDQIRQVNQRFSNQKSYHYNDYNDRSDRRNF